MNFFATRSKSDRYTTYFFRVVFFLALDFFAVVFLAEVFFFAVVFLADDFLAVVFFFAEVFFADFFFFADDFLADDFLRGNSPRSLDVGSPARAFLRVDASAFLFPPVRFLIAVTRCFSDAMGAAYPKRFARAARTKLSLRFRSLEGMRWKIVAPFCIAGFCFIVVPSRATGAEDDASLLKRLSQQFSDASRTNDVPVLAKLLDEHVTFINENGEIGTKSDLVSGPPSKPTPGVTMTLTQMNFKVRLYGATAVTSFTDHQAQNFHGQSLTQDFLSTEVWLKEAGHWKMISSQTLAEQTDPPAVMLPASVLDEYVGTYSAGPSFTVAIARSGDGLSLSANGGAATILKAELKDVFFSAGQPRVRRIFQRDANGAVVGYVSRHEGHDVRFTRVH